ncbi:HypC/HybG/HupF family hydrogenase formation chaperone [Deferrisoma camini]|uniref:HypC/HybG/HupF family hydrogenase formation chaperone n=1 Tax=Deferrisoma camini TaxID=1035120 RepID=UPI00046C975C|nr:HypC/HybG/HupF family hydrogenase formation chaperone [Deferrisoma camini]
MCVAVPGEIVRLAGDGTAEVDFGGVRRVVSTALLPEVELGDFVIVHAGFALHRVDPDEARQTRELFRQVLDESPS